MEPPPDPNMAFRDAVALARQGKYEEALQKHVWFHEHALEYNPAFAGVRLSFALAAWLELGEQYPKAKQALLSIRDEKTNAIANGNGSFLMFQDVAAINDRLNENSKTVGLFKAIYHVESELARQCYRVVEPHLVAQQEFAICSSCISDVKARFDEICDLFWLYMGLSDRNPTFPAGEARELADESLVVHSCRLIEILVAVGRRQEAEQVIEWAVALSDSAAVRAASIKALR